MDNFILEVGDCLDKIKNLDNNSIDVICTDPPYEIGFMNKEWDSTKIVFKVETWKEMLRVLKPGGILLVFGHSTKFHRVACTIEDAGFILRDTISWVYGSGFPKAQDVAKMVEGQLTIGKSNTNMMPKLNGKKNQIKNAGLGTYAARTGFRKYDSSTNLRNDLVPTTVEAEKWLGFKTINLKPAYEPIILAQKPLEKNYASNLLKWEIGAMNVDDNRIDYNNEIPTAGGRTGKRTEGYGYKKLEDLKPNLKGRFPSNFIHDGSDEVLRLFPETKSGYMNSNIHNITKSNSAVGIYGKYNINTNIETIGDSGNAARFFYCAKATLIDREEGLEYFELSKYNRTNPGGYENDPKFKPTERKNNHITVKPIKLMTHLISLFAPKNAVILDPFLGSGSTGKAVAFINRISNMNYSFMGYELSKNFLKIATARIQYTMNFKLNEEEKLKNIALINLNKKIYEQLKMELLEDE